MLNMTMEFKPEDRALLEGVLVEIKRLSDVIEGLNIEPDELTQKRVQEICDQLSDEISQSLHAIKSLRTF